MTHLLISNAWPFYTLNLICLELNGEFEFIGHGWCRSKCYADGRYCPINRYYKKDSNFNECKSACENEPACTGFDISNGTIFGTTYCFVYGNISSVNVVNWADSNNWNPFPKSTYGFKGFEVHWSTGHSGISCFKRLSNNKNDGKLSMSF